MGEGEDEVEAPIVRSPRLLEVTSSGKTRMGRPCAADFPVRMLSLSVVRST